MPIILTFRQLSFDTVHFPAGSRIPAKTEMFQTDPYLIGGSHQVMDMDERSLVQWLMSFVPVRSLIFEELGRRPMSFYRPEVVQPFYSCGEGEMDLLVCEPQAPHEALIMEAKRVKVEIVNPERDIVHKIKDIAAGVRKANLRYEQFAFFQHYLAVITVVDASGQHESNIPCRGLRSDTNDLYSDRKTFTRIVDFPRRDTLRPEIGIVFMEIVQPSRLAFDLRANFRICVQHRAQPREQGRNVTNRVAELMRPQLVR